MQFPVFLGGLKPQKDIVPQQTPNLIECDIETVVQIGFNQFGIVRLWILTDNLSFSICQLTEPVIANVLKSRVRG